MKKLYNCDVDLTASYGNINKVFIFSSIRNSLPGFEFTVCIDVTEEIFEATKSCVTRTISKFFRNTTRRTLEPQSILSFPRL